jgi:hypothetical protein
MRDLNVPSPVVVTDKEPAVPALSIMFFPSASSRKAASPGRESYGYVLSEAPSGPAAGRFFPSR